MNLSNVENIIQNNLLIGTAVFAAVIVLLLILNIVALMKLGSLKKKYKAFMTGKDAESLEKTIMERFSQIDNLKLQQEMQGKDIDTLKETILKVYQKFGMEKYDAFNEMGGKLSFSLAMLDQSNNGFLLTTVHNTGSSYTYVKEIVDGKSEINLSEEEAKALDKAINVR